MSEKCPVCQEGLGFEAWSGDTASFEICPGCGIQFGYNDARPELRSLVYAAWREEWLANDQRPFDGEQWHEVARRVVALAKSKLSAG